MAASVGPRELEEVESDMAEEEQDCIREFDVAKASGEEAVPLEQAIAEIEQSRS